MHDSCDEGHDMHGCICVRCKETHHDLVEKTTYEHMSDSSAYGCCRTATVVARRCKRTGCHYEEQEIVDVW